MIGIVQRLRPDLELIPLETEDGRPAFLVHDPATGAFDRVEWPESDLVQLLREPKTPDELADGFAALSPVPAGPEAIAAFVADLGRRGWLLDPGFWPDAYAPVGRVGMARRILGLLFIRIPLVRPAAFLAKTIPLVRLLAGPAVRTLILFLCLAGSYLALPRWEDYWNDGVGGFGWRELPAFYVALVVVKLAHELAHAYAATAFGARVASMGVALMFLMPLPFTDVTDAWRLSWSRRLRVASAGMLAEVALAGLTVLLWSLSPPGAVSAALARVSSVALFSTLLTNINPGPRFDGYYLLVCLLRVENLRERGAASLREWAWRVFFGIRRHSRDSAFAFGKRAGILLYAAYAAVYRIGLALGLALAAYHLLPKALGLPVALLEAWALLAIPALGEIGRFFRRRSEMRMTPALAAAGLALAAAVLWAAPPWPRRIAVVAVTKPPTEVAARTARSGVVRDVLFERGARVREGEPLVALDAPGDEPLRREAYWAYSEAALAEEQSLRDERKRRNIGLRRAAVERSEAELAVLRLRDDDLVVRAPSDGIVMERDDLIRPGLTVPSGRVIAWITDGPPALLACYVESGDAARIDRERGCRFMADDGSGVVAGRIVAIEESRLELLEDAALAGALGAVRGQRGEYRLERPYVKMTVMLDEPAARIGQTGRAWVETAPESLLASAWDWLRALAIRESGF